MLHAALLCLAAEPRSVELLSVTNATQLKAVFFSGEPWLVQCGSKADLAAAAADGGAGLGVHEVLEVALVGHALAARGQARVDD